MTHILRVPTYDAGSMPKQVWGVSYTDKGLSFFVVQLLFTQ